MIICKYEVRVSKENKPFRTICTKKFKTTCELKAYKIINRWNIRGDMGKDIKWNYDIISCVNATIEEINDKKIPWFYSESDC